MFKKVAKNLISEVKTEAVSTIKPFGTIVGLLISLYAIYEETRPPSQTTVNNVHITNNYYIQSERSGKRW